MLLCEQNTKAIERKVITCARKKLHIRNGINAFFEHGQWFVSICGGPLDGAVYSVVDTSNGIDLEVINGPIDH